MKLHVLTAVTRPENYAEVGRSILVAAQRAPGVEYIWHARSDPDHKYVGGQKLKNDMLDEITDGWVCILDDDTVMHENFLRRVWKFASMTNASAIIVSQLRTDGRILKASKENAVVGRIDAGQAILRRSLIGDSRIPESYAGDGIWLERLLKGRTDVHYLSDVLSLHNAISGIDVGPPQEVEA